MIHGIGVQKLRRQAGLSRQHEIDGQRPAVRLAVTEPDPSTGSYPDPLLAGCETSYYVRFVDVVYEPGIDGSVCREIIYRQDVPRHTVANVYGNWIPRGTLIPVYQVDGSRGFWFTDYQGGERAVCCDTSDSAPSSASDSIPSAPSASESASNSIPSAPPPSAPSGSAPSGSGGTVDTQCCPAVPTTLNLTITVQDLRFSGAGSVAGCSAPASQTIPLTYDAGADAWVNPALIDLPAVSYRAGGVGQWALRCEFSGGQWRWKLGPYIWGPVKCDTTWQTQSQLQTFWPAAANPCDPLRLELLGAIRSCTCQPCCAGLGFDVGYDYTVDYEITV